jgi:hypothetical protein
MDKDVVKSDVEGEVFDLTDFAFASQVVKDHPRILKVYEKLLPVLYSMAQYQCVFPVIQMVEDSKMLAQMQLDYYQKIYKSKGKINGPKTKK